MNRWSSAGFVPPPVYIGFPLFVLAKRRSEQLFTVPWRARSGLASGPTEMSAPCYAQLHPAPRSAVSRADPTRPLCVRVLDSTGGESIEFNYYTKENTIYVYVGLIKQWLF